MPRVSRPCEPTSCRKQVDSPAYLRGRSSGLSHSSRCRAAMGCSEVAIRYFSSTELSSAFSLPLPITWREGGDTRAIVPLPQLLRRLRGQALASRRAGSPACTRTGRTAGEREQLPFAACSASFKGPDGLPPARPGTSHLPVTASP